MDPSYDTGLVALSIVVAIGAAYTALCLAGRLNPRNTPRALLLWTIGGSCSMGFGIWSMHFIGMLAMRLPIPLAYDPTWTAASLGSAIALSGLALQPLHGARRSRWRLAASVVGMTTGICVMHYLGMAAIRIAPGIDYDPILFAASVVIALAASFAALRLVDRFRDRATTSTFPVRLAAAIIMGLAISGTHFTGMAAAHFAADAICTVPDGGSSPLWIAATIAVGNFGLMGIAVLATVFESHLQSNTARLNRSLSDANQKLARLAMHDALTGLPNRTLFTERLREALLASRRTPEILAVLFIDLDRFKAVNDTLGHHAGDLLLGGVATRLAACVGPADTLSRLGGDEFVILLRHLDRPAAAEHLAQRIGAAMTPGIAVEDQTVHIALSIGIAVYPRDGASAEALLTNADTAMYHAKKNGRSGYHCFTPGMDELARRRFEIENELRRAIPAGELTLHYQPQVSGQQGAITAVEALVRWRHPVHGLVPPGEFIPVAELTSLIEPLGAWVLREACRQNVAWQRAGLRSVRVAVNLSARQFQQEDLFDRIAAVLAETGMAPGLLEVELTESVVMSDPDRSVRILKDLDQLGVRIAIDDFGTGYSSLACLKRLPLHHLKLDRSFIHDLPHDLDDAAIVHAVLSMARSLGLEVIAEGVETGAQHAALLSLGCDHFQGYHFHRPVPPDAIAPLLAREPGTAASRERMLPAY